MGWLSWPGGRRGGGEPRAAMGFRGVGTCFCRCCGGRGRRRAEGGLWALLAGVVVVAGGGALGTGDVRAAGCG